MEFEITYAVIRHKDFREDRHIKDIEDYGYVDCIRKVRASYLKVNSQGHLLAVQLIADDAAEGGYLHLPYAVFKHWSGATPIGEGD